jgi:multimeric flavodoxin WrbA
MSTKEEAMKTLVLNGSPKGEKSATMQYVRFIQKMFPQHDFEILNISQLIGKIEKDTASGEELIDKVKSSDAVLWASPVYYLLVPANYKRFIELIFERGFEPAFYHKYTAFLSTSIHFFDHTAHNYMHAVCDDLDMKFLGSFSADMYDLTKAEERERLKLFAQHFFDNVTFGKTTSKSYLPVSWGDFKYLPRNSPNMIEPGSKKILILSDNQNDQENLKNMIERFKSSFSNNVEHVDLNDLVIKGACLGCIQCGYDNRCVYEGKDDFIDFYKTKVSTADILVCAGIIKDRYLSATWKKFFDRSFFKGHAPSLAGKQIGFIVSGPLSQIPNLRQILEAYTEVQHANLAGFVTDEYGDSEEIDHRLFAFGENLLRFADTGYVKPRTFLGVAGDKIFRDNIWGRLRFPFRADYQRYKEAGMYDFPQQQYGSRITNGMMLMLSRSLGFRKQVNKRLKDEMIKPLQKAIPD